jgi:hypothetical protein
MFGISLTSSVEILFKPFKPFNRSARMQTPIVPAVQSVRQGSNRLAPELVKGFKHQEKSKSGPANLGIFQVRRRPVLVTWVILLRDVHSRVKSRVSRYRLREF